jgi:hypothetical protein
LHVREGRIQFTVGAAEVAKEQLYVCVGAAVDAGTSGKVPATFDHDLTNWSAKLMQWRESKRITRAFGVSAEILFEDDVMRDMMACESRDFGRCIGAVISGCFLGVMVVQFMKLIECTWVVLGQVYCSGEACRAGHARYLLTDNCT